MEFNEEVEFLKKHGYVEIDFVETISFRINKELNEKLEQLAKQKQTTKSTLIRAALDVFVLSAEKLERSEVMVANSKSVERPLAIASVRINLSDLLKIDRIANDMKIERSAVFRYAIYKLLEKNQMI